MLRRVQPRARRRRRRALRRSPPRGRAPGRGRAAPRRSPQPCVGSLEGSERLTRVGPPSDRRRRRRRAPTDGRGRRPTAEGPDRGVATTFHPPARLAGATGQRGLGDDGAGSQDDEGHRADDRRGADRRDRCGRGGACVSRLPVRVHPDGRAQEHQHGHGGGHVGEVERVRRSGGDRRGQDPGRPGVTGTHPTHEQDRDHGHERHHQQPPDDAGGREDLERQVVRGVRGVDRAHGPLPRRVVLSAQRVDESRRPHPQHRVVQDQRHGLAPEQASAVDRRRRVRRRPGEATSRRRKHRRRAEPGLLRQRRAGAGRCGASRRRRTTMTTTAVAAPSRAPREADSAMSTRADRGADRRPRVGVLAHRWSSTPSAMAPQTPAALALPRVVMTRSTPTTSSTAATPASPTTETVRARSSEPVGRRRTGDEPGAGEQRSGIPDEERDPFVAGVPTGQLRHGRGAEQRGDQCDDQAEGQQDHHRSGQPGIAGAEEGEGHQAGQGEEPQRRAPPHPTARRGRRYRRRRARCRPPTTTEGAARVRRQAPASGPCVAVPSRLFHRGRDRHRRRVPTVPVDCYLAKPMPSR